MLSEAAQNRNCPLKIESYNRIAALGGTRSFRDSHAAKFIGTSRRPSRKPHRGHPCPRPMRSLP